MKVEVDRTRCTALGNCEAVAPDYFEVDDDGTMQLLRDRVDGADLPLVRRSVKNCPNAALSLGEPSNTEEPR